MDRKVGGQKTGKEKEREMRILSISVEHDKGQTLRDERPPRGRMKD